MTPRAFHHRGTHSPWSLWPRPLDFRNSLEPLASQIWMSLAASLFASVQPLTNHSSSSATPRQNTRLVVSRGNWPRRLNLKIVIRKINYIIMAVCTLSTMNIIMKSFGLMNIMLDLWSLWTHEWISADLWIWITADYIIFKTQTYEYHLDIMTYEYHFDIL